MKATAHLEVRCRSVRSRDSLFSVLAPDNEGAPRGLGLSMSRKGSGLVVRIEADTFETAVSTSMAFLRDIALFQEVWLLSTGKDGFREAESK